MAAGSTAFFLAIVEAGSWLAGRVDFPPDPLVTGERSAWQKNRAFDPILFWKMQPHLGKGQGTNSLGLRGPEIPPPDASDYRILSLGESTTFSAKIPYSENYSARLESGLGAFDGRRVRVINGGVPGYTLFQGYRYLEHYGIDLEPDAVLLYFGYNDYLPVAFREERDSLANAMAGGLTDREVYAERRTLQARISHFLLRKSNGFRALSWLAARRGRESATPVQDTERVRVPESDRWMLLQEFDRFCQERGIDLWVAVPWYRSFETHRPLLLRFGAEHDRPVIDLPRRLDELPRPRGDYFRDRVHPTSDGHREIARVMIDVFREADPKGTHDDARNDGARGRSPTPDDANDERPRRQSAYSVQLHVHGSFSEGIGSIDSHSIEAREVGVDAIWWSDHDFRISSYRAVSTYGFESWSEPLAEGEAWRSRPDRQRGSAGTKGLVPPDSLSETTRVSFVSDAPREGERSFRIAAGGAGDGARVKVSPDEFAVQRVRFNSQRALHRRPLAAGVRVHLSIFAEATGPDARAIVEFDLSEHAGSSSPGLRTYQLRYACRDGEPRREGERYEVPIECPSGEWKDHVLDLTGDAIRGFPEFPGEDNSLSELWVGVEARRGASVAARFDRLRIRQDRAGADSYAKQRELLDRFAPLHPGLTQLQGLEISYFGRHLNEFSVDTKLLDYDEVVRQADARVGDGAIEDLRSFHRFVSRQAVAAAHARGGLISYNHPFGTSFGSGGDNDPEKMIDRLVANRAFGADLLEVGYRERGGHGIADHLRVWDGLARAGLRLVGIGVSDSHGGPDARWRDAPNNFVSWIHARSPAKRDLLEGLRAGRVFFGDITLFAGREVTLDLALPDGTRMGGTHTSDARQASVTIELRGLAEGDRVEIVEASGPTTIHVAESGDFRLAHAMALPAGEASFVRVEVYAADGREKLFSNPIYFARP